jgi:hypothetical protein
MPVAAQGLARLVDHALEDARLVAANAQALSPGEHDLEQTLGLVGGAGPHHSHALTKPGAVAHDGTRHDLGQRDAPAFESRTEVHGKRTVCHRHRQTGEQIECHAESHRRAQKDALMAHQPKTGKHDRERAHGHGQQATDVRPTVEQHPA